MSLSCELIVRVDPASVCLSVFVLPVCINIFELDYLSVQWTNRNEFYQKHHWSGGKAALKFGTDRFRTLVSMATDYSYRVIMGKTVSPLFSSPEP